MFEILRRSIWSHFRVEVEYIKFVASRRLGFLDVHTQFPREKLNTQTLNKAKIVHLLKHRKMDILHDDHHVSINAKNNNEISPLIPDRSSLSHNGSACC